MGVDYRFQSDKRQIGGLMMLLGFCAVIHPSANIVSGFGPEGAIPTDAGEIPFWGLVGGLCLFVNGTLAVITGYMAAVHDWSHEYITQFLMVTIQTAWIPYITDMSNVGKASRLPAEDNTFIPLDYEPTDANVKFVGAMGVMAIMCYGFAYVGSIAFMVWSLHAYNMGTPGDHNGDYYKGRLGFYSTVLAVAGLVQATLGAYCAVHFETGTLSAGPVRAAMLTVSYPMISIFVGLLQFFNGLWALARSRGYHLGPSDIALQASMAFQWTCVVCLQILAQIGYLPGGQLAPAAPTVLAVSLGINLMPAYLDHKMRTLPAQFPPNYYSSLSTSDEMNDGSATKTRIDSEHEIPIVNEVPTTTNEEPVMMTPSKPVNEDPEPVMVTPSKPTPPSPPAGYKMGASDRDPDMMSERWDLDV